jgi:hypothetical protein
LEVLARWFCRFVLARAWVTFLVLVGSFLVFGAGTLNLIHVLTANLNLIAEHGWQALEDGAAQQFAEIVVTALFSMAAYVVFKACEQRLVRSLIDPPKKVD